MKSKIIFILTAAFLCVGLTAWTTGSMKKKLNEYHKFKRYAEKKGESFCGPEDPVELWKNFFGKCEKYQVSAYYALIIKDYNL